MDSENEKAAATELNIPQWFCIRSHPKREHIAAAHLRLLSGVEVYNPRIRLKKATRRGVVTFIEPLFPNYIFARFILNAQLDKVKYSPSVSTIVHFGAKLPTIPEEVIAELKETFGEEELQDIDNHVQPGDEVVIGEGPFYGMKAKVLRVLAPHQRVQVLLDMLGRTTPVVINPNSLLLESKF